MPGEVRSVESSHLPPRTPIGADEESSGGNPQEAGPPVPPPISPEKRATRIEKIEERRKGLAPSPQGEDREVYEKIEKLTRELYWLRQRAHSSFNELMANDRMPRFAKRTEIVEKEGGEKEEVVVKAEVSPGDITMWLKNGKLESYLSSQFEDFSLEDKQDQIEDLLLQAEEVTRLFEEIEDFKKDIEGASPAMLDMFYRFRLRELLESRMARCALEEEIAWREDRVAYCSRRGLQRQKEKHEEEKEAILATLREEVFSSPEAYYDYFGDKLLEDRRVLRGESKDVILETASVSVKINTILDSLRRGRPIFINGHLGSGKTQLAHHIAKKYLGQDALLISGHHTLEVDEITEARTIKSQESLTPEELVGLTDRRVEKYQQTKGFVEAVEEKIKLKDLTEEEAKRAVLDEYRGLLEKGYDRTPEVDYVMRPFYQAAKEGRMVIIDEMNAIPSSTLFALHDRLERTPCDEETYKKYKDGDIKPEDISWRHKMPTSGSDEIVIKPGFCVVATGNWEPEDRAKYVGTSTMNPAFMSRFTLVSYDYLPNVIEGDFSADMSAEEERKIKAESELYRLLCAKVINSDLSADVPQDAFEKLNRLAKAARITQDVFLGGDVGEGFEATSLGGAGGSITPQEALPENVLNMRTLIKDIIDPWIEGGFRYPLDVYIFNGYIQRSVKRPTEFMYLYKTIFGLNGFFDAEDGWPEVRSHSITGEGDPPPEAMAAALTRMVDETLGFTSKIGEVLYGDEVIEARGTEAEGLGRALREQVTLRHFSPTEVIEKVFGRPDPRARFPVFKEKEQDEEEKKEEDVVGQDDVERAQKITRARESIENLELIIQGAEDRAREQMELKQTLGQPTGGAESLLANIAAIESLAKEVKDLCDKSDSSLEDIEEKIKQINVWCDALGAAANT